MNNKEYVSPHIMMYHLNEEDVITTSWDNDASWDRNWTNIYRLKKGEIDYEG